MDKFVFTSAKEDCSLTPYPCQNELSFIFLISAILTGIKWNLKVVLICISLMAKNVELFFKCFQAIRDSSVETSLSNTEVDAHNHLQDGTQGPPI
jgi:glucan phosphoethanolaminetransferase (alkaline phosphatase superfamily)